MRMTYDPAADAMYVYLTERAAEGREVRAQKRSHPT
jgi:uncharacterized protein YuzE